MTKITVEVMPCDIRYGKRGSFDFCPIAFAINRLLRPGYRACVYPYIFGILAKDGVVEKRIGLPPRARKFIYEFDNEQVVSPISFTVDIPERFLR